MTTLNPVPMGDIDTLRWTFLLHFHQIASLNEWDEYIALLWDLERNFTSAIFDAIDPRKRNRLYSKYTVLAISEDKTIEDFYENRKTFKASEKRIVYLRHV